MNPRAVKLFVPLGMLLFCLAGEAGAAEPLLVVKCSEPIGTTITKLRGRIEQSSDKISNQSYTIIIYKPANDNDRSALVMSEGPNNLNEPGTYRAYGTQDNIIVDITILYDEATWIYSLFIKDNLLFIHSTKTGIVGNPTAHLLVATCS